MRCACTNRCARSRTTSGTSPPTPSAGPRTRYPWTGGSQVISPLGEILANAGETDDGLICRRHHAGDQPPEGPRGRSARSTRSAAPTCTRAAGRHRRPRRRDMYGPVPEDGTRSVPLRVATLQTSWYHTTEWTLTRAVAPGRLRRHPRRAAGRVPRAVHPPAAAPSPPIPSPRPTCRPRPSRSSPRRPPSTACGSSSASSSATATRFYSTAYLVDADGAHRGAATARRTSARPSGAGPPPGDEFVVAETPIGRIGLMIGDEIWLPEISRILALRGAEVVAHPVVLGSPGGGDQAATERTEENRVHLVSTADRQPGRHTEARSWSRTGSSPGQPIAVMRYPDRLWSRTGFEEDIFLDLDLTIRTARCRGTTSTRWQRASRTCTTCSPTKRQRRTGDLPVTGQRAGDRRDLRASGGGLPADVSRR